MAESAKAEGAPAFPDLEKTMCSQSSALKTSQKLTKNGRKQTPPPDTPPSEKNENTAILEAPKCLWK